jgi:hypothetical protein
MRRFGTAEDIFALDTAFALIEGHPAGPANESVRATRSKLGDCLPQRLLRGYEDAALKSHPCAQNAQGWGTRRMELEKIGPSFLPIILEVVS